MNIILSSCFYMGITKGVNHQVNCRYLENVEAIQDEKLNIIQDSPYTNNSDVLFKRSPTLIALAKQSTLLIGEVEHDMQCT